MTEVATNLFISWTTYKNKLILGDVYNQSMITFKVGIL